MPSWVPRMEQLPEVHSLQGCTEHSRGLEVGMRHSPEREHIHLQEYTLQQMRRAELQAAHWAVEKR